MKDKRKKGISEFNVTSGNEKHDPKFRCIYAGRQGPILLSIEPWVAVKKSLSWCGDSTSSCPGF